MSRVVYQDTPATAGQESLRAANGVRIVTSTEEGTGVNALPSGVYGFTYSPALPNAPLFAVRRFRSYETHKVASGEVFVIGFTTADAAERLASDEDVTVQIQPEPDGDSQILVAIPYSRVRHHRGYAAPNERGFTVTVG